MDGYEVQHDGRCITGELILVSYYDFVANISISLLCSSILRLDREQGCLYQHRP
jgi:hypothetical protein